jgi:hypothetical protein
MQLTDLSDDALLASLRAVCAEGNRLLARLVVHLGEVEERRLHLKAACSSMFDYCLRRLGMSEGAAYRRIAVARLARDFPCIVARIERGEVHLSALVLIRELVTAANVEELLTEVAGKSKREVQEIVARRAPKPDVPTTIRKLPERSVHAATSPFTLASLPATVLPEATPATPPTPARIEPLSNARYKLQLTASAELRDKLERATDLMRHRNPTGDIAVVIERALDALLATLEKERLGATTRRPHSVSAARPSKAGHIPRSVRREVFARDGQQCTFADAGGNRCSARTLLELDHIEARALGGGDDASNLRVRCRGHNQLHAEHVFGKNHVAARIHLRQNKSKREGAPCPVGARRAGLPRRGA